MPELSGKTVIVTGAGRGIGRGIALAAAAAGAKLVVADHGSAADGSGADPNIAEGVVQEIKARGGEAIAVTDSVAAMAGARNIVNCALSAWGRVDGLVCCAGIVRHRPFLELTEADFDGVITTHLKGHFLMFQTVLAAMAAQGHGGSLIGIGSGYVVGDPARAPYRTAKGGVIALTKSVALAGQEYGVRANVISPMANTRLTQASNLKFDSDPEDIGPMAVYLLSDRSAQINGEVFSVFGNTISSWEEPHERSTARNPERWEPEDIDAVMPWLRAHTAGKAPVFPPLPKSAMPEK